MDVLKLLKGRRRRDCWRVEAERNGELYYVEKRSRFNGQVYGKKLLHTV